MNPIHHSFIVFFSCPTARIPTGLIVIQHILGLAPYSYIVRGVQGLSFSAHERVLEIIS